MVKSAYDTLIVGAGLAGACAAASLSRHERVLLVDATGPAAGASGVGAGLVNPLMARRARPPWRAREALSALERLLEHTVHAAPAHCGRGAPHARGVLRPAQDEAQAEDFERAAREHPDLGTWIPAPRDWPQVHAPYGILVVQAGFAVSIPRLVRAAVDLARARGADVRFPATLVSWRAGNESKPAAQALLEVQLGGVDGTVHTRRLLLCIGNHLLRPWSSTFLHTRLPRLHLHAVKGQSVRIERPVGLLPLPALSGHGYIVDEGDTLFVGSTYEHTFVDLTPDPNMGDALMARASRMVPALENARIVERLAGCRATVPGTRLPMIGPVPGQSEVWVFAGLGSKGLLLAPLLADELHHYFRSPEAIPEELRLARWPQNR
ncbi:MAG: glycine oxidase [Bacteroidetes bacterium CG12_big_fil_rev_8_21_14_0_65_60_17]|nr:MAG: glycine oxidase [Bacteroidetes bacterium CG12_big_fil_rev_8_21_14_0_65_60_17]